MTPLDNIIKDLQAKAQIALQDYHERLSVIKELKRINEGLKNDW